MRQILYISTAVSPVAIDDVLATSRRNNRRDGITGLLYFNGKRFLQAIEGPAALVEAALARISGDARHRGIVILSDRTIAAREFGDWDMAYRAPDDGDDAFVARVGALVEGAAPNVRATFTGFAGMRRAA